MPRPESQKVVNMTVLSTESCRFLSFVLFLKSMNDHTDILLCQSSV